MQQVNKLLCHLVATSFRCLSAAREGVHPVHHHRVGLQRQVEAGLARRRLPRRHAAQRDLGPRGGRLPSIRRGQRGAGQRGQQTEDVGHARPDGERQVARAERHLETQGECKVWFDDKLHGKKFT